MCHSCLISAPLPLKTQDPPMKNSSDPISSILLYRIERERGQQLWKWNITMSIPRCSIYVALSIFTSHLTELRYPLMSNLTTNQLNDYANPRQIKVNGWKMRTGVIEHQIDFSPFIFIYQHRAGVYRICALDNSNVTEVQHVIMGSPFNRYSSKSIWPKWKFHNRYDGSRKYLGTPNSYSHLFEIKNTHSPKRTVPLYKYKANQTLRTIRLWMYSISHYDGTSDLVFYSSLQN